MADKVQLKEEIERRLSNLWYLIPEGEKVLQDNFTKEDANNLGKYTALESILQFIDSLPEEPVSENLEEAMERSVSEEPILEFFATGQPTIGAYNKDSLRNQFEAGAEWQKQNMKEALQTEYEKGRFDMQQEMMKDAVEAKVIGVGSHEEKDSINAAIYSVCEKVPVTKLGDKVKIIIVKKE